MDAQGEYVLVIKPPERQRPSGLIVASDETGEFDAERGLVVGVGPFVPDSADISPGMVVYYDHNHRIDKETWAVPYGAIYASEDA